MPIGYGLEPRSKKSYKDEWRLYLQFCKRRGISTVPGRDAPWTIGPVRDYLEWRSQRVNVRTLHSVRSKLKHCSICYGHLLPNAKGENPAELRLQLAMVMRMVGKRQAKDCKQRGISSDPKRSLALGRVAIGLLFSAYDATTEAGFRALDSSTRNWLATCACMHTGCMRFKLLKMMCKSRSVRWSQADRTYRLASDWRKMKRGGAFTVPFPSNPDFGAMRYCGYSKEGKELTQFTAATILRWHIKLRGSTKGNLFAPLGKSTTPSRRAFQAWLRASFARLLVGDAAEIAALVASITPHSFRAGMAGDLERERVPRLHIKKVGRWASDKAMEQYARDGLAQRLSRLSFKSIASLAREIQALAVAAHPKRKARSSDEAFGSSEEEVRARKPQR